MGEIIFDLDIFVCLWNKKWNRRNSQSRWYNGSDRRAMSNSNIGLWFMMCHFKRLQSPVKSKVHELSLILYAFIANMWTGYFSYLVKLSISAPLNRWLISWFSVVWKFKVRPVIFSYVIPIILSIMQSMSCNIDSDPVPPSSCEENLRVHFSPPSNCTKLKNFNTEDLYFFCIRLCHPKNSLYLSRCKRKFTERSLKNSCPSIVKFSIFWSQEFVTVCTLYYHQ